MLHNVVSPVTVSIFKKVGLDRLKQIIENITDAGYVVLAG